MCWKEGSIAPFCASVGGRRWDVDVCSDCWFLVLLSGGFHPAQLKIVLAPYFEVTIHIPRVILNVAVSPLSRA